MKKAWRFSKRTVIMLASALTLMLATSACGLSGTNTDSAKGTEKPKPRGAITVSLYDRGITPPAAGTADKNAWTEWINKNGPTDVTFITLPRNESVQKLNILLAAGNAPDYIQEFDVPFRNQMYTQKQIMPLDDLIEKYSTTYKELIKKYPALRSLGVKPDGKLYDFGRMTGVRVNETLIIRQDWLKKLNLEVPKTTEELYKVAKAFVDKNASGTGKKDTYGFALSAVSNTMVNDMFQNVKWVVDNGTLIRDWDRLKAATTFKKQLYDEGIIDKDYLADKNGEKARQDWVNGKLGIWGVNNGIEKYGLDAYEALKKNNPSAEVIAIQLPRSQFGQYSPVPSPPITFNGMINAKAKNPQAVIEYVDFMAKESTMRTLKYGEEGKHVKSELNGCPQIINEDTWKKEVSWTTDFQMLSHFMLEGKCGLYKSQLNQSNPIHQQFIAIADQAIAAYLTPERPYGHFIHPSYHPSLPQDLMLISTNTEKQMEDLMVKSIVSGNSYTVDQAVKDAQDVWQKSGGKKIEEWYAKWYSENKDKLMSKKEIYDYTLK